MMDRHLFHHEPACTLCSQSFCFKDPRSPVGARCPLLLKCGHSVCEGCLRTTARSTAEFKCKVCATPTLLNKSPKTSDLREECPLNVYAVGQVSLKRLIDTRKGIEPAIGFYKPKEDVTHTPVTLCCECNSLPAGWMCHKCGDYPYCEKCFNKVHSAGVALRTHEKVPFSEPDKKIDDEVMCDVHPGQIYDHYCEECKVYSCKTCLQEKHSNHTFVSIVEKNSELFQEYSDAYDEANSVLLQLKTSKKKFLNSTEFMDEEALNVQKQVAVHYNRLHGLLQLQEEEFMKKIKSSEVKTQNSLRDIFVELEESIQEMENVLSESKRLVETEMCANIPLFNTLEKLKNVSEMPCHIVLNKERDNETYRFFVCSEIEDMIKGHCTVTVPNNRMFELRSKSNLPEGFVTDVIPNASKKSLRKPEILNRYMGLNQFKQPVLLSEPSKASTNILPQTEIKTKKISHQDLLRKNKGSPKIDLINDSVSTTSADSDVDKLCKTLPLKEGSSETVRICHLISPNDFYIQRECQYDQLITLEKHFSKKANIKGKLPDVIEIGEMYLIQYKDRKWYRGVVKNIVMNEYEVFYIDYGNTEIASKNNFREIPEKFIAIPPLAVKCSLYECEPLGNQWSQDAIKLMAQLSIQADLCMNVMRIDVFAGFHEVNLWKYDTYKVCFAEALIFLNLASPSGSLYQEGLYNQDWSRTAMNYTNISIQKGESFNAHVTHINTPTNFFIRKLSDEGEMLLKLTKDLNFYYSKLGPDKDLIYNPAPGMAVAAKYTDGEWFRARVIKVPKPCFVEVQYVDYGNVNTVVWTDIRLMHPKFMKMGIQGLKCKLSDVAPKNNKGWTVSAKKEFENFTRKTTILYVYVDDITDTQLSIILYDKQHNKDINFNGVLVKRGHAKSTGMNSARAEYNKGPEMNSVTDSSSQKSNTLHKALFNKAKSYQSQTYHCKSEENISSRSESLDDENINPLDIADEADRIKIKILKYISPDEIYITLEKVMKQIQRLTHEMTSYYNNTEPEERNWEEDDLCAVFKKEDNKWYRGLIQESSDDIYQVLIKDIAEVVDVERSDLRTLLEHFKGVTDGSFRCHLAAIIPAGGTGVWSANSYDLMRQTIKKYPDIYMKKLGELENNSLPVQLWVKYSEVREALDPVVEGWKDINQYLVYCGVAFADKKSEYYSALQKNDIDSIGIDNRIIFTPATNEEDDDLLLEDSPEMISQPAKRGLNRFKARETSQAKNFSQEKNSFQAEISEPAKRGLNRFKAKETSPAKNSSRGKSSLQAENSNRSIAESYPRSSLNKNSTPKLEDKSDDWKPAEPFKNLSFFGRPTYVDNDCGIYIQDPESSENSLDLIRKGFMTLIEGSKPKPHDLTWFKGQPCIAYYETDQKWYRGRVMEVSEKNIQVLFVDYGNVESLQPDELRKQIFLTNIPIQCHRCVYKGLIPVSKNGKWPLNVLDFLHVSVVEKICSVQLSPPETVGGDYIIEKLILPCGYDLIEVLTSMNFATYIIDCNNITQPVEEILSENSSDPNALAILSKLPEATTDQPYVNDWLAQLQVMPETNTMQGYRDWILPDGITELQVEIVSFAANCTIKLHIVSSEDPEVMEVLSDFRQLQDKIELEAEKQANIVDPVRGQACVSCFTVDDAWYRAVIMEVYDDSVKVQYVDYGNEEVISIDRLRETQEGWMTLPAQAIHATLYNLTKGPNFSTDLYELTFGEVFSTPPYLMSIEKRQPDLQVDIFDSTGAFPYQGLIDSGVLAYKKDD